MPTPLITAIAYEDIATGKRKPITTENIRLSDIGSKPTVRVDAAPNVAAVKWSITANGKPVAAYPAWTDTNAPFRIVPKDAALNLPAGTYTVTITPCDAKGNAIGAMITATLSIGPAKPPTKPATDADPLPTTPGDQTEQPAAGLIKGTVGGTSVAPDAKVRRLDGSTTTYAALSRDVWKCKAERVWYSISKGEKPDADKIDSLEKWALACGIDTVIVCFTPDEGSGYVPTIAESAAFFTAVAVMFKGRRVRFVAELGNEPNEPRYWASRDMALLVRVFINPAVAVLHAAGIETIGASVTYSVESVKALILAGMATKTVGFHPYRKSARDLKALLASVTAVAPGKSLDLTEWNSFVGENVRAYLVQQKHPDAKDNAALQKYDDRAELPALSPDQATASQRDQWAVLKATPNVRHVCYYVVTMSKETATSPLALLTRNADGSYSETVYSRDFWAVSA